MRILFLFLIVSFSISGQENFIGIVGGINNSVISYDIEDYNNGQNFKYGFFAGVTGFSSTFKNTGVSYTIQYSKKGLDMGEKNTLLIRNNLNYIDVKSHFNVIGQEKNTRFKGFLGLGLFGSQLLNHKVLAIHEDSRSDITNDIEGPELNDLDFGVSGRLGIDFDLLILEITLNKGFAKIEESEIENNSTSFEFGIILPFRKK